jgi:hypothetical protein
MLIKFVLRTTFLVLGLGVTLVVAWYYYAVKIESQFKGNAKVLILGDSHTQNGVNPEFIEGSVNLSASAEGYFYSRIKLEKLLSYCQPSVVILGYSTHNIDSKIDSLWLKRQGNLETKVASYYPLLNLHHWKEILEFAGVKSVFGIVGGIFPKAPYALERELLGLGVPFIGGYTPNINQLDSQIKIKNSSPKIEKFSKEQLNQLNSIVEICNNRNISLILLNTPTLSLQDKVVLDSIAKDYSENLEYLDYSDKFMDFSLYADANHLNPLGAKALSDSINSYLKLHMD